MGCMDEVWAGGCCVCVVEIDYVYGGWFVIMFFF